MIKKKPDLTAPAVKERSFDLFPLPLAPSKCAEVVVITHKYTYRGIILAYAKQDGVVKRVLVEHDSMFRGSRWESVHDVFEVE